MSKRDGVTGYHVVEVTCRDNTERERRYDAGFTDQHRRDGFRCARCGEVVPHAGNAIHDVGRPGVRPPAPTPSPEPEGDPTLWPTT